VTGVVAAAGAHHEVDGSGEEVDDLALAFVAPLAADEDGDADGRCSRGADRTAAE